MFNPRCLPFCRSAALPVLLLLQGCAGEPAESVALWAGTMDTLPNGRIEVANPAEGVWDSAGAWTVVEARRIGTLDGDGPDLFGEIQAVEVDGQGRIWVLEGQANELRVFDQAGRHIRTVGRKGGGPGEFANPLGMAWSAAGTLWIPDPQNTRISVFDTAGAFVTSHPMQGGFAMSPWPGGFDTAGYFYNFVPDRSADGEFRILMVQYDSALSPRDSLVPPRYHEPEQFFELVTTRGSSRSISRTSVPYTPGLDWRLTTAGDFWFVHNGPYELYRVNAQGDTVRRVTKAFTPVPVTGEDVDSAMARLESFIRGGAKVDRGRIPNVKPAVRQFFVADDGYLWVEPTTTDRADRARLYEIFDPEGRYLGRVRLPFSMSYPPPVITGDMIVAVTRDELEVPFVVLARIVRPEDP